MLVIKKHGNMMLRNNQQRRPISTETFWMCSLVMHNRHRNPWTKSRRQRRPASIWITSAWPRHNLHVEQESPPQRPTPNKLSIDALLFLPVFFFLRYSIPVNRHVVLLIKTSRHYCSVFERKLRCFLVNKSQCSGTIFLDYFESKSSI